ncbi:MAG: NosD domain-containing protein [Candidatus Alcyoniella australis]|nr:NosD domain-containing protein [Candidatus Alcyoniella australis]
MIIIAASGVTLIGEGVTLQGNGRGVAIKLAGRLHDVTVGGFTILDYYNSVECYGHFSDILLHQMTIKGSRNMHLQVTPSQDGLENHRIVIEDIVAKNSFNTGIACRSCFDSVVRRISSSNENADVMESNLMLFGGARNLIEINSVYTRNESGCNAIWISKSDNNIIQNNEMNLGNKDGSHFYGSSHNIFRGNRIVLNKNSQNSVEILDAKSSGNEFYGNELHVGMFKDRSDVGSIFCVGGVGNEYLDGAYYGGPDPHHGTCP